mgnify:CR=1 FL=1
MAGYFFSANGAKTEAHRPQVHRFDGPVRGHGEPSGGGMTKYAVAGPVLVVIDAQAVGNYFEILDAPVAGIAPHFGDEFPRARNISMVSPVIPNSLGPPK